jgi:hypothetical protein
MITTLVSALARAAHRRRAAAAGAAHPALDWVLVPGASVRLPLVPAAAGIPTAQRCRDCAGTGISAAGTPLTVCACVADLAEHAVFLACALHQANNPARPTRRTRTRALAARLFPTTLAEVRHAAA